MLLSTGSLHLCGTQHVFELAAEAGFDGLEVLIDQRVDTWQPGYLARLSAEYGLPVACLHSPFLLNVPHWPAAEGDRVARSLELAEALDAEVVVTHLPVRWPYSILITPRSRVALPHFWRRNGKDVAWFEQQLPAIQAETAVVIAVEIMPLHRALGWPVNVHVWNTLAEWSRFEHLTLDTTHCGTWGVDPRAAYDRADGRVSHIHLSNFDGREHRLPHQGDLALDKFLRHVAADGYQGHISIETSPDAMQVEDPARLKENLAASLAFCREHYQR